MGKSVCKSNVKPKLRCLQINLKHKKEASDNLIIYIKENNIDIIFIQEPWVNNFKVRGLEHPEYSLFYKTKENTAPRACIIAKKTLNIHLMPNLSSSDTAVVILENGISKIILASSYMPHEEPAPTECIKQMLRNRGGKDNIIIACDANSRHKLWGNKETNERGESLLNFINQNNLIINNKGNVPTFIFPSTDTYKGWDAVLDLTISSNNNLEISSWRVSLDDSFSDHRMILFDFNFAKPPSQEPFRNPRNTDWEKFNTIMKSKLKYIKISDGSIKSIEESVKKIEQGFKTAYQESCKVTRGKKSHLPAYFDKTLIELRKQLRKQYNVSYSTGKWGEYKVLLNLFTSAKRKAKRESWVNNCEAIDSPEGAAKLKKKLSRAQTAPSLIMNTENTWAESSQESNNVLLNTHFPGNSVTRHNHEKNTASSNMNVDHVITSEKVKWAINSFDPYKSPGMDGVIPKMLQTSIEQITPLLMDIYKNCLKMEYIPTPWRKVRVVFLPKPGKIGHAVAKDYRPISLSSFLLKVMERLLEAQIRANFTDGKISNSQHAYMKGKSVETALHKVIGYAEKAIHHRQMALTAFLDIEGAFNNVTTDAIKDGLEWLNIEKPIINWVVNMLNSREIYSTIGDNTEVRYVNRGTPQGGVISPLLWLLVVNKILIKFDKTESKVTAYADDLAITIIGHDPSTIREKMEKTLNTLGKWAKASGLNINPKKTELLLFTRKRVSFDPPSLEGVKIPLSDKAKFLGVILTPKLDWKPHVEERAKKAQAAFYGFRSAIGKSWGLSPKLTMWIFIAIVRPILLYGVAIWWEALEKQNLIQILNKVQRSVQIGISGAMKTTSSDVLDIILGIPPIDVVGKEFAAKSAVRLLALSNWEEKNYGHSTIIRKLKIPQKGIISDYTSSIYNFDRKYTVSFPKRREWKELELIDESNINFFTDGSKTEHGSGAGVWSKWQNTRYSYKLPDYTTVFQSEIFAIVMACEIILSRKTVNKIINIFVDSQAALKAIVAPFIKSALIKRCVESLNKVCDHNKVILKWVPGHNDIEGNELADLLARQGSSRHISWATKIECPIAYINNMISVKTKDMWKKKWENSTKGRVPKIIWPEIDKKSTAKILSLRRPVLKKFMYTVTGHWNIGKHAHNIGIDTPKECKCGIPSKDIDSFHFWCECPSLARLRMEIFNNYFQYELPKIGVDSLEKLLEFTIKSKWF